MASSGDKAPCSQHLKVIRYFQNNKRSPFKMEPEPPAQRNISARLIPRPLEVPDRTKWPSDWASATSCLLGNCKDDKKTECGHQMASDGWVLDWILHPFFGINITVICTDSNAFLLWISLSPSLSHKCPLPLSSHQTAIWTSAWISDSRITLFIDLK